MSHSLLMQRRFGPLFLAQLFSAFNDNFLKNALVFLILYKLAGPNAEALITLAGALFIAPFFLLSGLGGELADRFDKALVARRIKLVEIAAAGVAVLGFLLQSLPILFGALALFGILSALFGPIKYGILPDHLRTEELPAGNALIEGATFIAILAGTIAGGVAARGGGDPIVFGALVMLFAVLCWAAAAAIPRTGEAAPGLKVDANVLRSTFRLLGDLRADQRLWRTGVMVSLFWVIGAVVMSLLPPMVKETLNGSEFVVSIYLAVFAVSIAVGSGIGSWLSSGRIVLLPVPIAAVAMGLFAIGLGWSLVSAAPPANSLDLAQFFRQGVAWQVGFSLFGLAVAGGVFIVPSFAATQSWSDPRNRARIVAAVNVLSAAFMVGGAIVVGVLEKFGLSVGQICFMLGAFCLASAAWIFKIMPTSPLRDFLSILFRAVYRLEVSGRENVAKAGANAIIAINHVSFLDAALILSIFEDEPVFAIDHAMAQQWWVRPLLKFVRAFPLDPMRPLATRSLINLVKSGETLVIFPEGRLTVTGSLMKIYDGAGLIAEKSGAMVVPVRIEGMEATVFSRLTRAQARRRWFPKVRVTILEPTRVAAPDALKGKARRQAAGAALYQIMSDLMFRTTSTDRSVFEAVTAAAHSHGLKRIAVEDPLTGALTYKRLLIGAHVLGRKLSAYAAEGEAVGVLLPNANGAAATILGLISAGRVPAMINFTAGAINILAACKAAEVKTIVTSRAFIKKGRLEKLVERLAAHVSLVYLEDVRAGVTFSDKMYAAVGYSRPLAPAKSASAAIILFTSGSEGAPKGVVLSHANVLANAAQAAARIDFGRQDKVFSVLPVFHSFGLTAGLILPLVSGVPVFLYPSPLHYRIVPELIYGSNATILFGTDTFLAGYARAANPYDFRSLRYVLAGAEPVKASTRNVYLEKFGLRILEGYGVTETAPVLALNTPMFNRFGTVGRLMPGMEARLEPIPGIEEGGRLYVRGPNVMLGYLRAENPGRIEPPAAGWHDTGDIVAIDRDGFITIKGRAKRFAKIAGEMVSLAAIESLAAECWPDALSAVVAIPDPRKGERLALVTQRADASRATFQAFAKAKGVAELMVPADVIVVGDIPLLGSGKIDFAGVKGLVEKHLPVSSAA
jgi:acyl-[acyl-carrier-protein]-phospholipid O-acyltransferase / long-chain-fatty-acid--[acyl-carrier-protein] ligase